MIRRTTYVVALAVLVAAPALALQSKTPPSKPAAAAPLEKRTFTSVSELQQAYRSERTSLEKELRAKELAAIQAYLKAKVSDKESALIAAQSISLELQQWNDAKTFGEQFASEFGSSKKAPNVKMDTARALSHLDGKGEEAKKLLTEVAAKAGDDKNLVFQCWSTLAEVSLDLGDVDGSRKAWDGLASAMKGEQGIDGYVAQQKAGLDQIGTEPKPFEVKDQNGQPLSLAGFKGKVVLLDFWATWCGPCREELPNVIATYRKYHDKGFEIVGVSLDKDEQAFKDFIKDQGMTWPQYYDGKGWQNDVVILYGVQGIPQTYLLDDAGKVYRIGLRGDALDRAVGKLLDKSPSAALKDAKKS